MMQIKYDEMKLPIPERRVHSRNVCHRITTERSDVITVKVRTFKKLK